jgi:23S rRNA (uracil1939-C5)-methyltransferase
MSDPETVVRLAARGDGVTSTGRYVGGVAPGDRVRVDGDRVEIEPGPHHQTPPCRHFPECGGCQLQQVDDAAYAEWMTARILHSLASQGVVPGAVEPAHLSPPRSRRRASLRAVRRGRRVEVGFNAEASHRIVDMQECHILHPALFALVAPLRELLGPLIGDGQGGGVTMTLTDGGIDLLLSNVDARPFAAIEALTGFAAAHRIARLAVETSAGIDVIAQADEPFIRFGGVPVALPPAAFLQATPDGEAALQAAVLAATAGARHCADLFCGAGTFALPLSRAARVHAADAAGPAVQSLGAAARAAGRAVTVEHRDLFRRPLRADELNRFDAVVIDPPRAGAKEQMAELARSTVAVIAAVSCNPNTFARDAALLAAGGYRLERLWPVGQFRWSTHVELAAHFVR